MKKLYFLIIAIFSLFTYQAFAVLPTLAKLNTQLETAQKQDQKDTIAIKNLEDSISLLKEIEEQEKKNNQLQELLNNIDQKISQDQDVISKLKKETEFEIDANLSIESLQQQLTEKNTILKTIQTQLDSVNSTIVEQNSIANQIQQTIIQNNTHIEELNNELSNKDLDQSLKQKDLLEIHLLTIKNSYNQDTLKNSDSINLYYQTQNYLLQLKEKGVKNEISILQDNINQKQLQQSQELLKQAEDKQQSSNENEKLQEELSINTELSKKLLSQTQETNTLSQDKINLNNVLDTLTQTQRTIEKQISALEGTLALSRIIQREKKNLPTNITIKNLPEKISELRVSIFDITQKRNDLYSPYKYIDELQQKNKTSFTDEEKKKLHKVLLERRKLLTDIINTLNNQLNFAIKIDLMQKQILQVSKEIELNLVQQSFWVKSNTPINTKWVKSFPDSFAYQLQNIISKFELSNSYKYINYLIEITTLLFLIFLVISYLKSKIIKHLSLINGQVNSLNSDSQWHTPIALFYTMLLTLPKILIFLIITVILGYFCFVDPTESWLWGIKIAAYLWLFNFILALFNEKGIAIRHFGLSEESCITFQKVIRRGMAVVMILLNISIFTNVTENGISEDVIGQIISILALIFCIFILAPSFKRALKVHNKNTEVDRTENILLTTLRLLIQLTPIVLIALIAIGYYYTALKLISLTITSYIIIILWLLVRYIIHRAVQVSARRLAYRRLQEQRRNKNTESTTSVADDIISIPQQSESIKVGILKSQIIHITNIILWVVVISLLYQVWSELIVSADYLNNISLWKQTVVTENGTEVETITLFNLLIAFIILTVTYILVRNIRSILEIFIFSRITLSQGTPYTITTLLTYAIVAIGSATAFSSLGMSWAKLQWLFAALSVGLGFGLQEIFANFISGIIILFERPIRIGDVITVGEFSGTVSRIRIRATTLMDFDGKEVIVPNKNFVTERLTNWALSSATTRVIISVGVAYGSDLELTRKLLLQAAEETDTVLDDPAPVVYFFTFGASTLDHELRVYVGEIGDINLTIDALNRKIDRLFAENGIEIAFNQLDLFIKNQPDNNEVALPKEIAKYAQAG